MGSWKNREKKRAWQKQWNKDHPDQVSEHTLRYKAKKLGLALGTYCPNPETKRAEAARCGLKVYFTGVPCSNGHVAPRLVASYRCIMCAKVYRKTQIDRKEEREAGFPKGSTYFTGITCKHGHLSPRYIGTGGCTACKTMYHLKKLRKLQEQTAARQIIEELLENPKRKRGPALHNLDQRKQRRREIVSARIAEGKAALEIIKELEL